MKILITGATGFIGSYTAYAVKDFFNCDVIAPVRKTDGYKNTKSLAEKGIILKEGNFYEKDFLHSIFNENEIDYVIHLASERGAGKGSWEDYEKINVTGTKHLLDLSYENGVKRFIYCSSVGVWGTIPQKLPPDETTPYIGDSFYHKSKIEAEKIVNTFTDRGLDGIIIRPTITYGLGDDGFPSILIKLVKNKMFFLPGKDIRVHFVSVRKIAELVVKLIKAEQLNYRVYPAVDMNPVSLKKMVNLIYDHYYGKKYPPYMKLPVCVFNIAEFLSRIFKCDLWTTRFKLISRNWYYNGEIFEKELEFTPGDTILHFKNYLNEVKDTK